MMMLSLAIALASASADEGPFPRAARPLNGGQGWVVTTDYPPDALREGRGGVTTVRLNVSTRGVVDQCAIAQSSGHRDLDDRACLAVSMRGRYDPARNADGRRVGSVVLHQIVWDPRTVSGG